MTDLPASSPASTGSASTEEAEVVDGDEPRRPNRARSRAVVALVVLTTVATFVSTIAVWAHGILLDTDRWVETVGPLAEDREVTDALAVYLVDEIVSLIDVQQLAADALPDEADFLAAPLTDAVQGFVTTQVEDLLATEQFATLWREANRFAHSRAVAVLRDEGTVVRTEGGEITLNLVPVIVMALQKLDDFGILPSSVTVPDISADTSPDDAVQALDDAFPRIDLPDDFGQITVYKSDTLAQAQDAVALFDRLVILAVVLTAGLIIGSIALSPNRRRTILQLGLSILAALVVSRALLDAASSQILSLISDDVSRSAAASVVATVLGSLRDIVRWVALLGIVAAAAAFFTGPSTWAVRTRELVGQLRPGGPVATGEAPPPAALRWIDRHRDALRIAGVVVALAWLVLGSVTFGSLLVMAVLLGAYEVGVALIPHQDLPADPAA